MKIESVMTKNPKTLKKNDKLEKVLKILAEKKISGCPVVDSKKKVIGVITQTDILKIIDVHSKIIRTGTDFFSLLLSVLQDKKYDEMKEALKSVLKLKAGNFMNKKVITIKADKDLYQAIRLMNKYNISRLPVIKENKLVGIITRWDIIRALEKLEKK